MCFGGGGGSADKIAQQQRADEVARQQRITQGMSSIDQAFSGFNPAFYAQRGTDYTNFAMPEVDRQAQQQHRDLVYALARTGNLDSSAAIDKAAELSQDVNNQRVGVANDALNQENTLRGQVEGARSNLVSQLNATGDSADASAGAMRQVQNLNQPTGFSPLGSLFLNFANSVAQIGSRAGNGYSGFLGNSGAAAPLFSASGGSQRVVG